MYLIKVQNNMQLWKKVGSYFWPAAEVLLLLIDQNLEVAISK